MARKQFFFGDQRVLEFAKFLDHQVDDLADGFFRGAGIDGHHARVGVGRQFTEDGVGETLFFADILEQARRHAAAK